MTMTEDESLLREMWRAYRLHATPMQFSAREAMAAVLAVVRAHDSASPTALANSGPKERQEAFDALKEESDDALAELAALRADAERYRWLRKRINWRDVEDLNLNAVIAYRRWEHRDYRGNQPDSEHIDDYIDAARGDTSHGRALH